MIDGSIHAGPNAVLSFKREGYTKTEVSLKDMADTFSYSGFWSLAAKHAAYGWSEMVRSWSRPAFVRSLQRLIPEVTLHDIEPSAAGVRAQALLPDGSLVDDFLSCKAETAARPRMPLPLPPRPPLRIGKSIVERIAEHGADLGKELTLCCGCDGTPDVWTDGLRLRSPGTGRVFRSRLCPRCGRERTQPRA